MSDGSHPTDGLRARLPPDVTLAQLRASIESSLANLSEVDRMLADIHTALARRPELASSARALLDGLLVQQEQTAHQLGLSVAGWVRGGGSLVLGSADASPSSSPNPKPVEVGEAHKSDEEPEQENISTAATPASPPPPLDDVPQPREVPAPVVSVSPAPAAGRLPTVLSELLALVGPPRYLNTVFEVLEEVEGLEALTRPVAMSRWPLLPKSTQRALLAMAVARTRAVKDKGGLLSPGVRDRLKNVIATFPAYAKRHAPGYVNGLQLSHDPEGPSWRADGVAFWEQLQRIHGHG